MIFLYISSFENYSGIFFCRCQIYINYISIVQSYSFERNVFFGVGLKNFRNFCHDETLNNDIDPIFHTKKCSTHPHSFYFEILSEIGIIGLLLLLCLFIFMFFSILKIFLKTKNYFLFLNSFIIVVYFIPFLPRGSFFTNWNAIIFWTIFAFLFANYFKLLKSND